MITSPLTLTPYARRYRRDLLDLAQDSQRLHFHLDWTTLDEWLDEPDVLLVLAWQGRTLAGVLAAAPPLAGSSWLRMAAIRDDTDASTVIAEMWPSLRNMLIAHGVHEFGALIMRPWLRAYVDMLGLIFLEDVVTLKRTGGHIPAPLRSDLLIRHGDIRDLETTVQIDHAAFGPLWRMSKTALRQAIRLSDSFTLALLGGRTVGYQLSSLYYDGAHLARLATLPVYQGHGIGGTLVGGMLAGFERRGINVITVNTQHSNNASQRLYTRYGFDLSGPDMPVWTLTL